MYMNDVCRNLIIGSILGDGHVAKIRTEIGTSQMEFKYCARYLEYLRWIHFTLESNGLRVGEIKPHQNNQYYFRTPHTKEYGRLRKLFYPMGVKIVPSNIKKLLVDSLSLAVWYMDDGTLDYREKYHFNPMLATYNFTSQECELLIDVLRDNFGIKASVTRCTMRGKVYPRVYVWSKSAEHFLDIIKPYYISCMRRKFIGERPIATASSSGQT
jgi:hypothetical protein